MKRNDQSSNAFNIDQYKDRFNKNFIFRQNENLKQSKIKHFLQRKL